MIFLNILLYLQDICSSIRILSLLIIISSMIILTMSIIVYILDNGLDSLIDLKKIIRNSKNLIYIFLISSLINIITPSKETIYMIAVSYLDKVQHKSIKEEDGLKILRELFNLKLEN